jgi:hypothetical protein
MGDHDEANLEQYRLLIDATVDAAVASARRL